MERVSIMTRTVLCLFEERSQRSHSDSIRPRCEFQEGKNAGGDQEDDGLSVLAQVFPVALLLARQGRGGLRRRRRRGPRSHAPLKVRFFRMVETTSRGGPTTGPTLQSRFGRARVLLRTLCSKVRIGFRGSRTLAVDHRETREDSSTRSVQSARARRLIAASSVCLSVAGRRGRGRHLRAVRGRGRGQAPRAGTDASGVLCQDIYPI